MLVKKQITSYVLVNIEAAEITLLSIEEYKAARKNITPVDDWWWLRTPGLSSRSVACVTPNGGVRSGLHVFLGDVGVRPALRFNASSANLSIGDTVRSDGLTWTYVSEGILLCDSIIRKMPFRKDCQAEDGNNYETSDVKTYLNDRFAQFLSMAKPAPAKTAQD